MIKPHDTGGWDGVAAELDRARDAGRRTRFWLRDDDAVAVTPALDRLHDLCEAVAMPILLAAIPAAVEGALGAWVAARPGVTPCQHGFSHANHAAPGERARELGGTRPRADILGDLAQGRARLRALFGGRLADILVPPWNRIDEDLVPSLPGLGFSALSTFGTPPGDPGPIARLNSDLDLIDWRHGRTGRTFADIAGKLAVLVAAARDTVRPIGILTHHLAHDAVAWETLDALLGRLRARPDVGFVEALSCLQARELPNPPPRGSR